MQGYIIESKISAKDVDALTRSAVAEADIDGGVLVKLGALKDGAFEATKTSSGEGLWMAYNPSEHLTKVGDKLFAGLSADPRDYTNLTGRTFDVFKPQVGDIVTFTEGNLATEETAEVGNFLEQEAGGLVKKMSATASTTSFEVKEITEIQIPRAGIGAEFIKGYVCEVVQN